MDTPSWCIINLNNINWRLFVFKELVISSGYFSFCSVCNRFSCLTKQLFLTHFPPHRFAKLLIKYELSLILSAEGKNRQWIPRTKLYNATVVLLNEVFANFKRKITFGNDIIQDFIDWTINKPSPGLVLRSLQSFGRAHDHNLKYYETLTIFF